MHVGIIEYDPGATVGTEVRDTEAGVDAAVGMMRPMTNDTELVAGLLGVYQRNFREEHYGGQWREIFDRYQRPLHDLFMSGDAEAAAKVLAEPATNHLLYGFENMFAGSAGEGGDADLLQLLAISLGAERLPNPGHERSSWRARVRAVVTATDRHDIAAHGRRLRSARRVPESISR